MVGTMTRRFARPALLGGAAMLFAAASSVHTQPAASLSVEQLLGERLGVPAAGALRAKGDLRRIVAWLRDIEAFMKAAGTENVGAIAEPAADADFARLDFLDADIGDLKTCRPGTCDVRMPSSYVPRFQKEVAWDAPNAQQQAEALARALIHGYARAYQSGGDAGVAAFDDHAKANKQATEFQDLLRRSTKVWELAHPFVNYLETFPHSAPPDVESRFYWTRDQGMRKPTLTLHHVVLQQLPEGRLLVADKQFYASRDLSATGWRSISTGSAAAPRCSRRAAIARWSPAWPSSRCPCRPRTSGC